MLKGGVDDDEMKEILEITNEVWDEVKSELRLSDSRIAEIIQETEKIRNPESLIKSIKKARHEARCKLQKLRRK